MLYHLNIIIHNLVIQNNMYNVITSKEYFLKIVHHATKRNYAGELTNQIPMLNDGDISNLN